MPLHRFVCANCKTEHKKLLTEAQLEIFADNCKVCGGVLNHTLGLPEARPMETTDEYRGKTKVQGVEDMIEERANAHDRKNSKSV